MRTLPHFPSPLLPRLPKAPRTDCCTWRRKELQARLPPSLDYVRSFARTYLTRLCQTQAQEATYDLPPTPPPSSAELATWILQAPPMTGLEYLREEALVGWWTELDAVGPRRDPAIRGRRPGLS